ncbi:MAG: molybdopterin-dependent oxidoreductase, partial [Deltaproteobacteria bacterium]|nr:molybdopterin-dependent oxidoreductase [Deltaproteobacteria bacterium]
MEAITFTLNGSAVSARAGKTILEVARDHGIDIPTLCHHDMLRPIGACRLCQVEDEKRGLILPACVTTVQPDMEIQTHSERVVRNRRNIVRLLLASHPESCLVCEKGNRCELRKLAAEMGIGEHGLDPMPYHPGVIDLNPNIARDLSKCILCAKCIRADQETVVEGVIDYHERGFDAHPGTLFMAPLEDSECTFCGTCLSVCPTGALQERNKPRLDHAGARTPSVCSWCACGCSIFIEHNNSEVLGVSPTARPDTANGISLCVKGHFGHDYLSSPERLRRPLIKTEEGFEAIGWDQALDLAADKLGQIKADHGSGALGFIGGSRSTNEENLLFKKLAQEALGSDNLASLSGLYWGPAAEVLKEATGFAAGTGSLKDLEASDLTIVIGADPTRTAPLVGYHLKRAVRFNHKKMILIDPLGTKLAPFAQVWLRPQPAADRAVLAGLVKAVLEEKRPGTGRKPRLLDDLGAKFEPVSVAQAAAQAGLAEEDLRQAAKLIASAQTGF